MQEIKSAVSHLKQFKSDGSTIVSSDCIIHAGDDFIVHFIALLFSALTVHGTAPANFHLSTIVPIPKCHNFDKTVSSNFRGIRQNIRQHHSRLILRLCLVNYSLDGRLIPPPIYVLWH